MKTRTSNAGTCIYGEIGRYPLYINQIIRVIKYWFKVVNSNNCIIQVSYKCSLLDCINGKQYWTSRVKDILCKNGYGYIWQNPHNVNKAWVLNGLKQRLSDCFVQNWRGDMLSNGSLLIYKHMKTDFKYEAYLNMISNSQYRYLLT